MVTQIERRGVIFFFRFPPADLAAWSVKRVFKTLIDQ
jgi:hypothetical protein